METREGFEYIEDDEVLLNLALLEAKKRFNEFIENHSRDAAFFSIDLEGYLLSRDFKPLQHKTKLVDTERKKHELVEDEV